MVTPLNNGTMGPLEFSVSKIGCGSVKLLGNAKPSKAVLKKVVEEAAETHWLAQYLQNENLVRSYLPRSIISLKLSLAMAANLSVEAFLSKVPNFADLEEEKTCYSLIRHVAERFGITFVVKLVNWKEEGSLYFVNDIVVGAGHATRILLCTRWRFFDYLASDTPKVLPNLNSIKDHFLKIANFMEKAATDSPAVADVLKSHLEAIPSLKNRLEDCSNESKFAFVGETGSGKSTLINSLLGQQILPEGASAWSTSAMPATLHYASTFQEQRVEVEFYSKDDIVVLLRKLTHLVALQDTDDTEDSNICDELRNHLTTILQLIGDSTVTESLPLLEDVAKEIYNQGEDITYASLSKDNRISMILDKLFDWLENQQTTFELEDDNIGQMLQAEEIGIAIKKVSIYFCNPFLNGM